ncbi:hypothetical protein WDZ16_11740 [Pseudokineococcus marinus]|uniref:Excreted virulence factor EspC, type VII ESX diderm n=1 Tax=Pseudokineococcus marinus TaxID=351215 RepID=A0A849BGS3_9ACTN|nr:hypothetical protein [Pseudokineococcus marinus]NNH22299.1 hypothetical protein [Pseudokineococcus marinus]
MSTGGETLAVDQVEMEAAQDSFNDLAAAYRNAGEPLTAATQDATTGAGQFATHLSPGVGAFLASWQEALSVCSTSAGLVASNIGRTATDVSAVDVDASTAIVL